jgi:hypothetical protein
MKKSPPFVYLIKFSNHFVEFSPISIFLWFLFVKILYFFNSGLIHNLLEKRAKGKEIYSDLVYLLYLFFSLALEFLLLELQSMFRFVLI